MLVLDLEMLVGEGHCLWWTALEVESQQGSRGGGGLAVEDQRTLGGGNCRQRCRGGGGGESKPRCCRTLERDASIDRRGELLEESPHVLWSGGGGYAVASPGNFCIMLDGSSEMEEVGSWV